MDINTTYTSHVNVLQQGVNKALDDTQWDALLIHAGRGIQQRRVDDCYWPLKVNPSFAHWCPLLEQNSLLLIEPGQKPKLFTAAEHGFWEGPAPAPALEYSDSFIIAHCPLSALQERLPKGAIAWIGDVTDVANELGISKQAQNPTALLQQLEALRTRKTPFEIACLAKASEIAGIGHAHVAKCFADSHASELELHLEYLRATKQDATQTPYGNIFAQGRNAAILHHVHYQTAEDRNDNQSLLVDAGATSMSYASDITRTYTRGNRQATREFQALIDGVTNITLALCDAVRPGIPYEDLHDKSHQLLANLLLESGLCSGSADALVAQGITRAFFPHGLGHSLGLQVHDVGCKLTQPKPENPFLRNTSVIAEGQVFTIEPGCYFIDAFLEPLRNSATGQLVSWPTVDALYPYGGIRIEDNIQVTADGSVNLTRDNWPTCP